MCFLICVLIPMSTRARVCACVHAACLSTGLSPNSSAFCRAVTAHKWSCCRGNLESGQTTWNNLRAVSARERRGWGRLSHFSHHLSCKGRLPPRPVGGSRGEVNGVQKSSLAVPPATLIDPPRLNQQKEEKEKVKRQTFNYLKTFLITRRHTLIKASDMCWSLLRVLKYT